MPLTGSYDELVQQNIANDAAFASALLREAVEVMLAGDVETGKALLRQYIKATVGFEKLAEATGTPAKSLIRMFGPRGNPQTINLFAVIAHLQRRGKLRLEVNARPKPKPKLENRRRVQRSGSGNPVKNVRTGAR
jgi:DNA-binding phage protein